MQITEADQPNTEDMQLQSASAPSPHSPQPKGTVNVKLLLIVLGVVVALALAVGLIYAFVLNKPENIPAATSSQTATEKVDPITRDVPDAVGTETYDNPALGLQLTLPATWKTTEADNGVRIESQAFTYKDVNGSDVKGNFRIYIRMGARPADSGIIGRGYAITPSEKLIYTKPAAGQRTETLITAFGLDEPNNFAYFMIAGNFQLVRGDTLGPNYAKELDAFVIAGGYSTPDIKNDLGTTEVPASSYTNTNAYKQAIAILKSIQVR